METKTRRRLWALILGWAAPVGVGTVTGVVARLPSTIPTVEVWLVVVSMVAFTIATLVGTVLAVLGSPGMVDGLCRIIDAFRGRPPAGPPPTRRSRKPRKPSPR
jgi:hypothetical protein